MKVEKSTHVISKTGWVLCERVCVDVRAREEGPHVTSIVLSGLRRKCALNNILHDMLSNCIKHFLYLRML